MLNRAPSAPGDHSAERPRSTGSGSSAAAVCVCALLILPAHATAQHHTFVDAVAELTAALPGTYGDEGPAVRAAIDRLERGLAEWDQTLREYEANVESIRPTAAPARILEMHRTMGMFYLVRGRLTDAVREFEVAVASSPEPLFHLFLGLAHDRAGRSPEALGSYATAAKLDASDPVAAYMLAEASVRAGSSPPAAALATLIDVVDRMTAGRYTAERDPFLATAVLPDEVSETPTFVPWWYAEAFGLLERQEYARALDALRVAAARDPLLAPSSPTFGRGVAALRAGRVDQAREHFTLAVADAPSSEGYRLLGLTYWLAADIDRGIEHLEEAVRLDPTNERARVMLVRLVEDAGDTTRAERLLTEAVEAIPASATAHLRLGRLYESASRTEDAVRAFEAAAGIGAFAGQARLHVDIGELYRRELDTTRAEAAFARAIALRPNDAVAHRERGRALLELERPDAALVELAAALIVDQDDYLSYLAIGQIHLDAGRFAQAASALTRAIAVDSEKPDAHYALASVLTRSGRGDEATPHLTTFARLQQKALDEQRRRIDLSTSRLQARVLVERGEFELAVKAWSRIVAEWRDVAAHHAGLAAALAGLGQVETAIEHYEKALTLNADAQVYGELAAFYDRLGRADAAARTRTKLGRTRQVAFGMSAPSAR